MERFPFGLGKGHCWLRPEDEPTRCPSASKTNLQTTPDRGSAPALLWTYCTLKLQLTSCGRVFIYKHHELRYVNSVGANSELSSNTYFETDMAGTKNTVQKQHLSCLSASRYGAVLTMCCRRWGDIVLYKHCFLVVTAFHNPPRFLTALCVLKSNVIMNWQVK